METSADDSTTLEDEVELVHLQLPSVDQIMRIFDDATPLGRLYRHRAAGNSAASRLRSQPRARGS